MKKETILMALLWLIFSNSCKEIDVTQRVAGSINVINAVVDIPSIKVNTANKKISYNNMTDQVNYGTNKFYYVTGGSSNIEIVSSTDTSRILINTRYQFKAAVYTMYLSGTSSQVDTMFKEEVNFPYIATDVIRPSSIDSVVKVRFANLSANSPSLYIKIKNSTVNEVAGLAYRNITEWRAYPAKLPSTSYIFEVRVDPTSAIPITSLTFTANAANRFKNISLIARGTFGVTSGTNMFRLSAINYF